MDHSPEATLGLETASWAKRVPKGEITTKEFFLRWPDIAQVADTDICELWYTISYYENDAVIRAEDKEHEEYFRRVISERAAVLERRYAPM